MKKTVLVEKSPITLSKYLRNVWVRFWFPDSGFPDFRIPIFHTPGLDTRIKGNKNGLSPYGYWREVTSDYLLEVLFNSEG